MEDLYKRAEELFQETIKLGKFGAKHKLTPINKARKIREDLESFSQEIKAIEEPSTRAELYESELKRRVDAEILLFENWLSGKRANFETTLRTYSIDQEDIKELRPWLEAHKDKAIRAVDELFDASDVEEYDLGLNADIPRVKNHAIAFAEVHVQRYHKILANLVNKLTSTGEFLRDMNAEVTMNGRSYFHPLTNTIAIGIAPICRSTETGDLDIRQKELIRLYGHEGTGHALNEHLSRKGDIPGFLKLNSAVSQATGESIAQYYERQIFEDLKNSPETQKALGIQHIFEDIYAEIKQTDLIEMYGRTAMHYQITILADKSLGDPQDPEVMRKKAEMIQEICLTPGQGRGIVERHRYQYDTEGNLNNEIASEIRYCARPVDRALRAFEEKGLAYGGERRGDIDKTLLTGLWTPIGYVQHAKIRAEELTSGSDQS